MSRLDDIYQRAPIWAQSAMVAAFGAAWYFRRFGRHYRQKVEELNRQESWTTEQFYEHQLVALRDILQRARQAPYYREAFAGVPASIESLDGLARYPFLTKQTLRTRARDLLTDRPPRGTKVLRSSGTTGTPTDIYYTRAFHQTGLAYFQARSRSWAGVAHGDERAMFGVRKVCRFDQSRPPYWRRSPIEHLTYYSIYHLAPRMLPDYVAQLRRQRPRLIMGYPSAINLIARHLVDRDETVPVQAVITTSETVTPAFRAICEQAFQCLLYDQYGAVEGTHFVSQCREGRYHVSPERGIIEILDGDRPCLPGEVGRVVVTGLENTLQPLIRYEIGDAASWSVDQACPCGRKMPIMEGIEGRYEDYCTTPDGRRLLRFDTVFKGITEIIEAQVIQDAGDHFTVRVVPGSRFSDADRRRIVENFRLHAGDVAVDVVEVDQIPRTAAGKYRAVINRVDKSGQPDLR